MKPTLIVGCAIGLVVLALCGIGASALLSGSPLRVRRVNGSDPALKTAMQRAHRELPEFLRRLSSRRPGERFAVRVRFPTATEPEFLWVRDPEPVEGDYRGTLDEPPFASPNLKKGEGVRFKRSDIVDWLIGEPGGRRQGGYTEEVLGK